nr:SEC-C domain-containing protein [uncultured Peptostreptococcus sp.]
MLNRNDLCHCGSGKKYKKCCMEVDLIDHRLFLGQKALYDKKQRANEAYSRAIIGLSECLEDLIEKEEFFANKEEEARNIFFDDMIVNNIASNRFFASYFSYDYMIDGENTPAMYVIGHKKFNKVDRELVVSCLNSHPSLFIIDKFEGLEVVIKDIFTGSEYYTLDAEILDGFEVGQYLLARPVKVGDIYILTDLTIRIQEDVKKYIYKDVMKEYKGDINNIANIDYFISINALYFYKHMLNLLQMSDYKDSMMEESLHTLEADNNLDNDASVVDLLKKNIEEEDILDKVIGLWTDISSRLNLVGAENGWASGFEYYYRKSIGQAITQNYIAQKYGVSTSTLAKRNKDILAVIEA